MSTLTGAHFEGWIRAADEHALREHLCECPGCSELYERYMLLQSLDPKALAAKARLARGLGLRERRGTPWRGLAWGAAAAPVAAALLLFVARPLLDNEPGGFVARGTEPSPAVATELLTYRVKPGKGPALASGDISVTDELAFAYRNGSKKKRLMVFGVDERQRVYWYFPAWQDASTNPVAVPIKTTPGVHELPEAVSHRLRSGRFDLVALFTDRALTVRQVEQALAQGGRRQLRWPDVQQRHQSLRVIEGEGKGGQQ